MMKGLQALFNQDNGTGRVQSVSSSGLSDIGRHLKAWYEKLPSFYTDSMSPNVVSWSFNDVPTGNPGGTDGAVFACNGTPSFGMGAVGWNYSTYTWHTNRDTYDKVVFDDLKHNATLAAMLAYRGVGGSRVHRARQVAGHVAGRTGRRTAARRREKRSRGSRTHHDGGRCFCSKLWLVATLPRYDDYIARCSAKSGDRLAFAIAGPAGFVEENPHSCDAPDGGRVHRPVFLFTRIRIPRGAPSNGDLEGRNFTEKGCPDDSPPSRPRTSFPTRARRLHGQL